MYARVTLLEIDTMRAPVAAAVAQFEREVLPELQAQDGYRGVLVLATPEGKAALLSMWDTEEQANVGGMTGFYAETLARYVTLFAAPPGRERYEVMVVDVPAVERT
jgi:heme-degrading monooxygenase HmoA